VTNMHEFGLMKSIVDIVYEFAMKNRAEKVTKIIVDIGAISGVVPEYLSFYFEPCTKNTVMEGAQFETNLIPAIGNCNGCSSTFDLLENNFVCPACKGESWELTSGKELNIQGIEVI